MALRVVEEIPNKFELNTYTVASTVGMGIPGTGCIHRSIVQYCELAGGNRSRRNKPKLDWAACSRLCPSQQAQEVPTRKKYRDACHTRVDSRDNTVCSRRGATAPELFTSMATFELLLQLSVTVQRATASDEGLRKKRRRPALCNLIILPAFFF